MRHEAIAIMNNLALQILEKLGHDEFRAAMLLSKQLTDVIGINLHLLEPRQSIAPVIHSFENAHADKCEIIKIDTGGFTVQHVQNCNRDCAAQQNAQKLAEKLVAKR